MTPTNSTHVYATCRRACEQATGSLEQVPLGVATGLTTVLLFQEKGTTWLHLWGAEECRGQ